MDIHSLFRGVNKQLLIEFESSKEINHSGSTGTYRENSLKKFLLNDKLPLKYGIGSGEIVNTKNSVSKQSDLIIYDRMEGIPFLYDVSTQIFPIECIYGVIEVKSKLSKTKLLEGLKSIKSVKNLTSRDIVQYPIVNRKEGFIGYTFRRPIPFGIIFAYDLEKNSLESLMQNLYDWEMNNEPHLWPNLVVVLNKGIVYHEKDGKKCLTDEEIDVNSYPAYTSYKDDTLLHFYSILLDLCRSIPIAPFNFASYMDLPTKIGTHLVESDFKFHKTDSNGELDLNLPLFFTEKFIEQVIHWCKSNGKLSLDEISDLFGFTPKDTNSELLNIEFYLYHPDNSVQITDGVLLRIDGENYIIPQIYVMENDLEEIKGRKFIYKSGSVK